jgi:hypothetical protein
MLTNWMFSFTRFLEIFRTGSDLQCRYRWLHGLRHRSGAARLLRLWVRERVETNKCNTLGGKKIPPRIWIFVCYECFVCVCVLPGTGLCNEVITRPDES